MGPLQDLRLGRDLSEVLLIFMFHPTVHFTVLYCTVDLFMINSEGEETEDIRETSHCPDSYKSNPRSELLCSLWAQYQVRFDKKY